MEYPHSVNNIGQGHSKHEALACRNGTSLWSVWAPARLTRGEARAAATRAPSNRSLSKPNRSACCST